MPLYDIKISGFVPSVKANSQAEAIKQVKEYGMLYSWFEVIEIFSEDEPETDKESK